MNGLYLISAVLLITSAVVVRGQTADQFEYVVMFMRNFVEEVTTPLDMELYIGSRTNVAVNVIIDNPNGGILTTTNLTLAPNTVHMQTISQTLRQESQLDNKAIRVRSTGNIVVYALNRNLFSTDGLTIFNVAETGKEYYALAYTAQYNTQIGLIALEDSTTINVTVPVATAIEWYGDQYNAGEVINVVLINKYNTALLQSVAGDVTGARLISTKKFAAFSGNVRASVDGTSRDHLVEQLPPMPQWGFNYYTVRTPGRTPDRNDIVRIVAHEDNTKVEVRGAVNEDFVLNGGQFKEIATTGALWINSTDKSVMVGLITSSQSQTNSAADEGDPSMIIMPAVGQYDSDYLFSTPSYIKPTGANSDSYDIYVLIISMKSQINGLTLNGAGLGASWTDIASTDYSFAHVRVSEGTTYNLKNSDSSARFMGLLYGSADRESFYFPIDVGQANINVITPIDVVGNKGEGGDIGDKGLAGATGPTGLKGQQGATGERGNRGSMGISGQKGDPGVDSLTGSTGANGATGSTGATGSAGIIGATGFTGSTGATGATGSAGPKGDQGNTGVKGTVGIVGEVGEVGYRGTAGQKGTKGAKGVAGIAGPVGPKGDPGETGFVAARSCDGLCGVQDDAATATCRTTFGTVDHLCSCPAGYHLTEANPNLCIDIDECALELCSHNCTNSMGSYTCSCPGGYTLVGNNCVDIDECAGGEPCGTETCVNGIGSFVCLLATAPPPPQALVGLQMLYDEKFFIAMLVILVVMTILLAITSICLLTRHSKRSRLEKRRRQLAMEQARVIYPATTVLHDGYY